MLRRILFTILALVLALGALLAIRTVRFRPRQVDPGVVDRSSPDPSRVAAHLSEALRFRTVSYQDPAQVDAQEFARFREFLARAYPLVHSRLVHELVGGGSLLYRWEGTERSREPILLMAHMDVVPVEPGTERLWKQPPFEGRAADGAVWGRGAIDDKLALVALMDATEGLLAAGFQPRRTVYLELGHDEETGGTRGAAAVAELLRSRGVRFEYVLDEGGMVFRGGIPGVTPPVALVAVAEKGYLTLELSAESAGGHSSMPPPHTASGLVAAAAARLENNPMPAALGGAIRQMLGRIGPEMPLPRRLVLANLWLFGPAVLDSLADDPKSNAMIRTTTAVTMLQGSAKENVLPIRATAIVNFRILPGDTVAGVTERVRRTIDDSRVKIRQVIGWNPSRLSDLDAPAGMALQRTLRRVYPDALVSPMLMLAATDSRRFVDLARNVYGFMPVVATPEVLGLVHSTGERVRLDDCGRAERFYRRLIEETAL